jgi:hypothetical protein
MKDTEEKSRIRISNPVIRSEDPYQNFTDPEDYTFLLFRPVWTGSMM